jgi:PAS domain S-box-containing protein
MKFKFVFLLVLFLNLQFISLAINEIDYDSTLNSSKIQALDNLLDAARDQKIKDFDSAQLILLAADHLVDSLIHEGGDVNKLITLGHLYFDNGYFENSKQVFDILLQDYQTELTEIQLAEIKHTLGLNQIRFNNYDKAINNIQEALIIFEEEGLKNNIARALKDIGAIYYYLNNTNSALDYYQKSLIIYREVNDSDGIARSYNNIGLIFKEKGNYALALEYLNQSLEIKKTQKNLYGIANTIGNMGAVYMSKGQYDEAINYFNQALEIWQSLDYLIGITEVYNYLGDVYIKKGNYEKAIENLLKGRQISLEHNFKQRLIVNYELLSIAYFELKDFEKSIVNHRIYNLLKDSLYDALTKQRMEEYLIRNENLKAENEIIAQDKKILQQRFQIILILVILLAAAVFLVLLIRQNKLIRKKSKKVLNINKELDERVQQKTSELRISQFSIDMAVDSIFWMKRNGRFLYVNHSACSMLGYSKTELLGMSVFDIVPEFSQDLWQEYWQQLKKKGSYVIQLYFKTKLGHDIPVEAAFNFQEFEGEELNFVFSRNIAERKLTEEKLKSAKEKAERSDKLKSAFLANMSHEIRTPMNAIIGFINLLGDPDITQSQKDEIIQLAQSSSNDLLNIVNDIIDISKIEADELTINKSLCYVNRSLRDIYKLYQNHIELNEKEDLKLKLSLEPDSDRIVIYTDFNRFKQIMNNLISNAIKFTEKGEIVIGYRQITKGGLKLLRFYVKDTGIGIPDLKQDIIFDRFNHLTDDRNKVYKGTGLGLAISKRLVDLLGGTIGIESEEGMGSEFYFTLPYQLMDTPDHETIDEQCYQQKKTFWPNKKILVVEDTPSNFYLIENYLKPTKVQLHWAKSGNEAIQMFKDQGEFDLVLMDIQLPGINGYEATKLIKSYNNKVPVVAQTAYALAGEREYSLKEGCDDYISKPIKKETLIELLYKYLQ